MLPVLGHNSQHGSTTPARHASQNQGSVEQDDVVDDKLIFSCTP